jgi:hypothetical protein
MRNVFDANRTPLPEQIFDKFAGNLLPWFADLKKRRCAVHWHPSFCARPSHLYQSQYIAEVSGAGFLRVPGSLLLGGLMKVFRYFGPMIVATLILVGSTLADVHTDYDHKADFSRYHTYQWIKVQTTDPLWQQRISEAVDHELQAKGWQRVDSGADVALSAVGATHNQQEYQTFYNGLGGWRWRGMGETTTTVENYPVGTLVLDMYDGRNHQLIWRGTSSDTLSSKPSKNEKKLDKDVSKMFDKFPPKTDKG